MKSTETTDSSLLWVGKVAIINFYSSFNVSAVILVTELIAFESIFDSPLDIPSVSLSPFTSLTLLFVFFLLTLLPELDWSYFCCGVSLSWSGVASFFCASLLDFFATLIFNFLVDFVLVGDGVAEPGSSATKNLAKWDPKENPKFTWACQLSWFAQIRILYNPWTFLNGLWCCKVMTIWCGYDILVFNFL